jgi:hypothetical protein
LRQLTSERHITRDVTTKLNLYLVALDCSPTSFLGSVIDIQAYILQMRESTNGIHLAYLSNTTKKRIYPACHKSEKPLNQEKHILVEDKLAQLTEKVKK